MATWPAHGTASDFSVNYADPEHIKAFREALAADPQDAISAATDWAPFKQRVKKSNSTASLNSGGLSPGSDLGQTTPGDVTRAGWAYTLTRPPLLALLGFLIFLEFWSYIAVRQLVVVFEWTWNWWGTKGRLRRDLREASSYKQWKTVALKMDEHMGFNKWKAKASYAYYDAPLVKRLRDNLRQLREAEDAESVKTVLEICLRSNFAGIEHARLYSETYFGTKILVEDYLNEVERCIAYIRTTTLLGAVEKRVFFKSVSRHFGSTCLCLSGGASLGYYHLGVVRALLDAGELPKIISGTSAGSLVAALVCCRTDEELDAVIKPELANRITAFDEDFKTTIARWWNTGARFDAATWAEKCSFFTLGSMTFKEAYERTGRILSVSVVPYESSHPTQLLNYLTAPDTCIFSACIASAAVPGLLQPVVLMNKTKSGNIVPGQFSGRHKDGSLRVDIPLQSLHLLFNCNFSITYCRFRKLIPMYHYSSSNHEVSSIYHVPIQADLKSTSGAPGRPVTHRKGKGWRGGFLLSAAEQFLKIELSKNFRVIRDLELLPNFAGQNWSAVFLQKFEGSVTLFPRVRVHDWLRLLTDPDEKELERMIDAGQRATWPKLHMISNRQKIERQIEQGRLAARDAMIGPSNDRAHSPIFDPAEATSALEDSDSDFELHKQRDYFTEGGMTQEQGTVAPTTDREAEAIRREAKDQQGAAETSPRATAQMRKARRKAIMRKLGLTNTAGAPPVPQPKPDYGSGDVYQHHRAKSVSSLGLQKDHGDRSSEDEGGYLSA